MSGRRCLIACEVFRRELEEAAARSPHQIEIEYVEQGIHDKPGAEMAVHLQQIVSRYDGKGYEAILMGYALCNHGIVGLSVSRTPMVVPRAHDCIALFLGGRPEYEREFKEHPGTYYLTSGWIEHADRPMDAPHDIHALGMEDTYRQYVEKFGEENAQYLMETLGGWTHSYERLVFINNQLGDVEAYRRESNRRADERGVRYEEMTGNLRLFHDLVNGPPWKEEEFLVVPPGHRIRPTYEEDIMKAVPINGEADTQPRGQANQ